MKISDKHKFLFLVSFVLLISLGSLVFAQSDLPIGLQKIIDYNISSTSDFAVKISFFIAFVAGMLAILSPCILPFIPVYFSYTFKEKKNITKMTFVFFAGFSFVFIIMGIIAGFLGEQVLNVLQKGWLVSIAGAFMIFMGILTIRGKKVCSYININKKFTNDAYGTFLFGNFFAIGWTACLGPILAGILGIGAILGNVWQSATLLFFYSLGNLVPLFLLSIFYDKFKLSQSKLIKGKTFSVKLFGKEYFFHSTNLISGLLFLTLGSILIVFKGTAVFNTWDFLGTKRYFYSIQRALMEWEYANYLGIVLFALFLIIMGVFLWGNNMKKKQEDSSSEVDFEENQEKNLENEHEEDSSEVNHGKK